MAEMADQRDILNQSLIQLAAEYPQLLVLSADMGSRIVPEFMQRYPERFLNFGVAEQNMVSEAAGLARMNYIPCVTTIAAFLSMRSFEQIRTDVAYPNLNVKIIGTGGGMAYGNLGPTHFALEDLALMRTIPNLTILSPADASETQWALVESLKIEGPVYIRLDRGPVPNVYGDRSVPSGLNFEWVTKPTTPVDVLFIATGPMVYECLGASRELGFRGISCGVINARVIKPLDEAMVAQASHRAGMIVTVEDHTIIGGMGSAIASAIATRVDAQRIPVHLRGVPDVFPHQTDSASMLRRTYGIDTEGLTEYVLNQNIVRGCNSDTE